MGINRTSVLVTTDVNPVTTAETIIATIAGVTTPRPGCKVVLFGSTQITIGTNATALTFRWRRGAAITDPLVGEANVVQIDTAAGSSEDHVHSVEDTPGEIAGQTYVLTVQQTAATANATVSQTEAWADVVS